MEDVVGTPFWEARWFALSEESRASQREMVLRAAQGEFIRRDIEVYGEASGERTIITDYSLTPLRDEAGEVRFILAEGRNITEKKKVEVEVARKKNELEELLKKKPGTGRTKKSLLCQHQSRTQNPAVADYWPG